MKLTKIALLPLSILLIFMGILLIYGFEGVSPGDLVGLLGDKEFLSAVVFGLETSLFSVLLSAVFGIPAGFYLARNNSSFSRFADILFDIPLVIPPLVVGALLLNLFNCPFVERFYSFVFTFWGAAIAQFFISFPFTVKSSKTAFELISPVYERIAMTLGASPMKSFFDTTFRLSFYGIFSGLILSWLRSLGEFGATLLVGGGIAYKTENIPINIYLKITEGNFRSGFAASLLVVVLAIVCVFLVKMVFSKKRIGI
ncbi:molybdate ABC transporter permease subunit [Hippea maritima]|uniref:ABC-type transporter, integral membrane subunit n=1 Tax=Hippea maritima (strain ATCC 700847 / DSM 10411 / MH2) TaxID=760142 RepID=F2LUU5_HIPMA|nr:ABC transporter permease subunit [Hippea maritima]AEA33550.1 ABC-type transporter, integral membrane subunit [Hippea maritima DSM 10411]